MHLEIRIAPHIIRQEEIKKNRRMHQSVHLNGGNALSSAQGIKKLALLESVQVIYGVKEYVCYVIDSFDLSVIVLSPGACGCSALQSLRIKL